MLIINDNWSYLILKEEAGEWDAPQDPVHSILDVLFFVAWGSVVILWQIIMDSTILNWTGKKNPKQTKTFTNREEERALKARKQSICDQCKSGRKYIILNWQWRMSILNKDKMQEHICDQCACWYGCLLGTIRVHWVHQCMFLPMAWTLMG